MYRRCASFSRERWCITFRRSSGLRGSPLDIRSIEHVFLASQIRLAEICPREIRLVEVRDNEKRLAEIRSCEIRSREIRIAENCPAEIRLAEIRLAEIHPLEIRVTEICRGELRVGELRVVEVWTHRGMLDAPRIPFRDPLLEKVKVFGIGHSS